jgi:hypothetical protein
MSKNTLTDPTTSLPITGNRFDAEEPDTNADPEGAESRTQSRVGDQTLPGYLADKFVWTETKALQHTPKASHDEYKSDPTAATAKDKRRKSNITALLASGKRPFWLNASEKYKDRVVQAAPEIFAALQAAPVKPEVREATMKFVEKVLEHDRDQVEFKGEWSAHRPQLDQLNQLASDIAYIAQGVINLEDYQGSTFFKPDTADNWESNLLETQARAVKTFLVLTQLQDRKGQPILNGFKPHRGVYNALEAAANRNMAKYYHPEELEAKGAGNMVANAQARGAISGLLRKRAA